MSLVIPTVTEQTPRGERLVDLFSRLLGSRIVFLGTQIDETSANLVIAQLLHLDAEDAGKDIYLYINSPGGDMTGLFAIYDTMQFLALGRGDRLRRPGLLGRRGAARRRRQRASASCCPTRGS